MYFDALNPTWKVQTLTWKVQLRKDQANSKSNLTLEETFCPQVAHC